MKRDGDNKIPTRKLEMIKLYKKWRDRQPLVFLNNNESNDNEVTETNGNDELSHFVEL